MKQNYNALILKSVTITAGAILALSLIHIWAYSGSFLKLRTTFWTYHPLIPF